MTTDATPSTVPSAHPGRLGDPDRSLRTDPRSDPRMVDALSVFGLDELAAPPPLTRQARREDLIRFATEVEAGFEAVFASLMEGLPPVEGVVRETAVVGRKDGREVQLYIHRPESANGPLPCIYHLHGGGMVVSAASDAVPTRWRDELAATGLVVVGVEFRNGAGKLGPHRFPAGLDDCSSGLQWVKERSHELGVSGVVVSGDSGGANLALALAIRAKKSGWSHAIAGVYALCPYLHGHWSDARAELPSLQENNGYIMDREFLEVLSEIYDPVSSHADDPTCWPYKASTADLEGLPPHVISVNEVDPLRDEGIAYYRMLLNAGVEVRARVNLGVCHVGETLFRAALPDLYAATVNDIRRFAHAVV